MRVSNPFKILGKVDVTVWGCLVQLVVLAALVGLALTVVLLTIAEK